VCGVNESEDCIENSILDITVGEYMSVCAFI
jgi:hypothetical protein